MDRITRVLADSQYMLLTTFRRNGAPVSTPVWVVADGGSLAVWTVRDSGKVKRIRRSGAVELVPCDVRGTPRGDAIRGRASVLDDSETQRVKDLLVRKYKLIGWLYLRLSAAKRGVDGTVALSITVG